MPVKVSEMDVEHLCLIREGVVNFMRRASKYAVGPSRLLDIAPQIHEGAHSFFPTHVRIETLDIDPKSGATYIADICKHNSNLSDNTYDFVVCTEVLEHTFQPFDAVGEMHRILKIGGLLFISVPFNFRIHGPLPDCWRFTEHGLRALLSQFTIVSIDAIETPSRQLMPIQYTVVARKG